MPRCECLERTGEICDGCAAEAEDRADGYDYSDDELDYMADAAAADMVYGRWEP